MPTKALLSLILVVVTAVLGVSRVRAQSIVPGISSVAATPGEIFAGKPDANSQTIAGAPFSKLMYDKSPESWHDTRLGPVLPENIKPFGTLFVPNALTEWAAEHCVRFFGWANGGYTQSSTGEGLLAIEPRQPIRRHLATEPNGVRGGENTCSRSVVVGLPRRVLYGCGCRNVAPTQRLRPIADAAFRLRLSPGVLFRPCPHPDRRGR